jgi:hypothetical protein
VNVRSNLIWSCGTPLIVVGLLLLVFLPPDSFDNAGLAYLFGTVFGQATLAAAWTAFGPLPLHWRLPLSLLWIASLIAANAFNSMFCFGGLLDEFDYFLAACLTGQYALLQAPLGGLAFGYGLRLRSREETSRTFSAREMQFGIRQLMIFTTVVAVVLGAGRIAVMYLHPSPEYQASVAFFVAFLAVVGILVSLPLILVALLPRFAIPAVAVVLMLVGLFTAFELPLYNRFDSNGFSNILFYVYINCFTAAWILVIALLVRISGYGFSRPGTDVKSNEKEGRASIVT